MKIAVSPTPLFNPRDALIFLAVYMLSLAVCIAVPRGLTFLPSSVALLGLIYIAVNQRALPHFDKKLLAFFAAFTVLACASAAWAPDPSYSFCKALKTGLLLFTFIIPMMAANAIPRDMLCKNKFIAAAVLLCAGAGAIIAFEYSTDFYLARLFMGIDGADWPASIQNGFLMNRGSIFLVLLSLPVMLLLRTSDMRARSKNILTAVFIIGIGALLITTNSQTAQIVAIFALPMLAYPAKSQRARRAILYAVLAVMFAAPFLVTPLHKLFISSTEHNEGGGLLIDASMPHRMEVWQFMAEQIKNAPFLGHGMESTRTLRAGYVMPHMQSDSVLHPHNAILQIWIEFGIVGIVLCAAFICFLLRKLDDMPALLQRYYVVLFIVLLGVLSIGYGLWQAWLIGMIQTLITTGFIAIRLNGLDERP